MEEAYTLKNNTVHDNLHNWSYNLSSNVDARKLYETLTDYENNKNTTSNLDKEALKNYINQLELSINILKEALL